MLKWRRNFEKIEKTSDISLNKHHYQRDISPKISLNTKSLNKIGLFWSFPVTLCEGTITKSYVGVTKHIFRFGVKTQKMEIVQEILRGTRKQLLL